MLFLNFNLEPNPEGPDYWSYTCLAGENVANVLYSMSVIRLCLRWGSAHSAPGSKPQHEQVAAGKHVWGGEGGREWGGIWQGEELAMRDPAMASTTSSNPSGGSGSPTWSYLIHCLQNCGEPRSPIAGNGSFPRGRGRMSPSPRETLVLSS